MIQRKFARHMLMLHCLFLVLASSAQYNNEWIDHGKTYHRFKVGRTGLYRITQQVLASAGLGSARVEHFQLWRNGEQVPIYTSIPAGILGSTDFIECYGQINDGRPDTKLYRDSSLQLADKWSLFTDTAAYFLTVHTGSGNLRYATDPNPVASNTLPAEPWFMHTLDIHYKTRLNNGYGLFVGLNVYSSSYEVGEGWASRDVGPSSPLQETLGALHVASAGPDVRYALAVSGNTNNTRTVQVSVNGTQVLEQPMNYLDGKILSGTFARSLIGKATDQIVIANGSTVATDRIAVHKLLMTYPRTFDFDGASQFRFSLPQSTNGNYLEIVQFRHGAVAPLLIDLTNKRRYVGDVSVAGKVRFALPASGPREFVLLSRDLSEVGMVTDLQVRNFTDYSKPASQSAYLIISNKRLFSGANGNPVEAYRAYRASAAGGGHDARIYDIEELVDQFAFGIKMHPLSVVNFLRFARQVFNRKPSFVFLIGRGLTYDQQRIYESRSTTPAIALIPTFGNPGSDNLLSADGYEALIQTPIGRLAVVHPSEIEDYLVKVKEHELVLKSGGQTIRERAWMKNVVHAVGGSDPYLQGLLFGYMNAAKSIVADTLFGANVKSFSNNPAYATQQLTTAQLQGLFSEGINMLTYFGHSSASALEFNISDPNAYDNQGKYPMFVVNGCNAGNFFLYDTTRVTSSNLTLSEKYVMARQRGSIGFIASTHYGIVNYLNIYVNSLYSMISGNGYGQPIGVVQQKSLGNLLQTTGPNDHFGRMHAEQITLHGDPAVAMYAHAKPDYVIEDAYVRIDPSFVSVADARFRVQVKIHNIGRAVRDSVSILLTRRLPSGATVELLRKRIPGIRFVDSVMLDVPVNPLTDKGDNRITVQVDPDGRVDEISEANNIITKSVMIIEDELRPVFPHEYGIVSTERVALLASTANPLSKSRSYLIEVDTTSLFNSPGKKSSMLVSVGGILSFDVPGLVLADSTVYYWRTAPEPPAGNSPVWNASSFTYLKNAGTGFSQAHYHQHLKSGFSDISLDADRRFRFAKKPSDIVIKTGIFPIYPKSRINVQVDEKFYLLWGCRPASLQFMIYDSISLIPVKNKMMADGRGLFGSYGPCQYNEHLFEYPYDDVAFRKSAMDLLDSLPVGYYVSITNLGLLSNTTFVLDWQKDTLIYGSGRSLYHSMRRQGLIDIDQFTGNFPFIFFFRKGDPGFPIYSFMGRSQDEYFEKRFNVSMGLAKGEILSPWFGPAKKWHALQWAGAGLESAPDKVLMDVIGREPNGVESILASISPARDTSLAFIDAARYTHLRLRMYNSDSIHYTPHQLRHWRLTADLPPEGAIAPNIRFSSKDSLETGEPLLFEVAFKNTSSTAFDSLRVAFTVTDRNNVPHVIPISRRRPLPPGDTILVSHRLDTRAFSGSNTVYVNVNPDNDQPEQFLFNNFLYRNFHVGRDDFNPVLDVTFNGMHILNRDIISSRPHILIRLKDDSRYLPLDDTALLSVSIRYPDGVLRGFRFDNDTMRFTPAGAAPNADNTASIDLNPVFFEDGEYELIVNGRDRSGNAAGKVDYRVLFNIFNKPMISNLLNYPNPFSTSTAFVFTVTGSEVPRDLRIQILTVTGKIVREITAAELGPLRIGRNITDFKWDGSDQYGQRLANGVYLYRFIASMNGKPLEKLQIEGDKTDAFFHKGYGKMYIMR